MITKTSQIPFPPISPANAGQILDIVEKSNNVASAAIALNVLKRHTDPVVQYAAGVLEEMVIVPWLEHANEISRLPGVTEADYYDATLPGTKAPIRIGSSSDNDVQVIVPGVDRYSFSIHRDIEQEYWYISAHAKLGGSINGKRVEFNNYNKLRVVPGDIIDMGEWIKVRLLAPESIDKPERNDEPVKYVSNSSTLKPAASVYRKKITLKIFRADELLEVKSISKDVIRIGKLKTSDILLEDDDVARMHAVIEFSGQDVRVIDLGSASGTGLNGTLIDKTASLKVGDCLMFGRHKIEILEIGDADV